MKPFKAIFGIFALMCIFHVVGYSKSHDAQTTEKTESVCRLDNQLATMEVVMEVGNYDNAKLVANPIMVTSTYATVNAIPSVSKYTIRFIHNLVDKGSTIHKRTKHGFVKLRHKVGWRSTSKK
jgi:hypothetical protein